MRKYFFILNSLLLILINIQAVQENANEIVDEIIKTTEKMNNATRTTLFNKGISTEQQNESLKEWEKTYNKAKTFIIAHSKDLLKKEDPMLIQALTILDNLNIDLINTIKISRHSLASVKLSALSEINNTTQRIVDIVYKGTKSFILSNKKNASLVLRTLAGHLGQVAMYVYKALYNMGVR